MSESPAPLVSVALCTYNGERFLREQVDSVLNQTYRNVELVVRDDGSRDDTMAILADYAARDSRVRYAQNPHNLGFRENFQQVLQDCRGDLIALCDQDDIWAPDKLESLAARMNDPATMLAFSNSELIDAAGVSLGPRMDDPPDRWPCFSDPESYLFVHRCSGHTLLVRRSIAQAALPFPEKLYHDWWIAFVAACHGTVAYVDRCLVKYRRHAEAVVVQEQREARDRAPGYRLRELEDVEHRLAAFASYPGPSQAFFQALLQQWQERKSAFFSPRLAALVFGHRRRLYPYDGPRFGIRQAWNYFWGLRLKRLIEPRGYRT